MSAVGTGWELQVWAPHLKRLKDGWCAETGRAFRLAPDEVRDEIVLRSLDVLPVPVVQVPYTPEGGRGVDLGWVGEALARLEAAGKVSSVRSVDRECFMRRGVARAAA